MSLNSKLLAKLLYLDVGRADFSGCHLEEIWLFVTGLSYPNGNIGESTTSRNCWHYIESLRAFRACNE